MLSRRGLFGAIAGLGAAAFVKLPVEAAEPEREAELIAGWYPATVVFSSPWCEFGYVRLNDSVSGRWVRIDPSIVVDKYGAPAWKSFKRGRQVYVDWVKYRDSPEREYVGTKVILI